MHQIYLITNLINGKVYVGQTSKGLAERWNTHVRGSRKPKSPHLYSAFRKYGLENFSMTSLSVCDNKEEADYLEKFWILFYDSRNPLTGYNMTDGGEGGDTFRGRKHSEETLEKMRIASTGRLISESTKEKLRQRNIRRIGEEAFRFNRSMPTSEVIRLYQAGMSTRQIASLFGMEKTAVISRLKKSGVSLRPNSRDLKKAA